MKDPSDAMYVEAQIPHRDLYAFTCEDKQDMNAFLAKTRDELRLKVSALHSGENYNRPYPPNIPLPKLRYNSHFTRRGQSIPDINLPHTSPIPIF